MKQILSLTFAFLLIATGARAYNEPAPAAGTNGQYQVNSAGTLAGVSTIPATALSGAVLSAQGGTGCTTANCYYGLPNFRKKLAALRTSPGNIRVCHAGDSTTFGTDSTSGSTGDVVQGSYPSQLATLVNNNYGFNAERNSFLGDGGTSLNKYGTNDARIVQGSSWTQDLSIASFGGATFAATTSTNSLAFTPTVQVDTFKIMYIVQPTGGTLSVNIDGGTATTYNTAGTASLGVATLTTTLGSHTINFNWSAGGQVDVVGVYDSYDSSQNWISFVNMGWVGSTSENWATTGANYNPGVAASWAVLGCDLITDDLGINNWNAGFDTVANYTVSMQTLITAQKASTTDLVMLTPVPSSTAAASVASQNSFVNAMYGLANTNGMAVFDMYKRWGTFVNGTLFNLYQVANTLHPNYNGYADEAYAIAQGLLGAPTQPYEALGNPYQLYNPCYTGCGNPTFTISSPSNVNTGLGLEPAGADLIVLGAGQATFNGVFFASDNAGTSTNLFAASKTQFGLNSAQRFGWTSSATNSASFGFDTAFSRLSAGVLALGSGAQGSTAGSIEVASLISAGTKFTTSGCSVSATTGGATAGTYTSGTSGTCTTVLTMNGATGLTAPNGWACSASDRTTQADIITQTASTTTTATLAGPTNSGDIIGFFCMGY